MKAVNNAPQEEASNSIAFYIFSALIVIGLGAMIGALIYFSVA